MKKILSSPSIKSSISIYLLFFFIDPPILFGQWIGFLFAVKSLYLSARGKYTLDGIPEYFPGGTRM